MIIESDEHFGSLHYNVQVVKEYNLNAHKSASGNDQYNRYVYMYMYLVILLCILCMSATCSILALYTIVIETTEYHRCPEPSTRM